MAVFFGSTIILIIRFRESGAKLEIRANTVIKEKEQVVSKSFLELLEEIFERFKTERTLTNKLEEKFGDISYVRYRLLHFSDDLAKVVRKLTYSVVSGFTSAFFMIFFTYTLTIDIDPITSFWLQIIVGAFTVLSVYRYLFDGLLKIYSLRTFEELVNKIERSKTFDQLYELL